jgi:hypothetical protein
LQSNKAILSINLHNLDGFILLSEKSNQAVRNFAKDNKEITLILPSQTAVSSSFTIDSDSFRSGKGMFNIRDIDETTYQILSQQFDGRFGDTALLEKFVLQLA